MVYNVTTVSKDMDGEDAEKEETDTFLEEAEGNEDSAQSSLNSLSMECERGESRARALVGGRSSSERWGEYCGAAC